jgi:hypothetical protein
VSFGVLTISTASYTRRCRVCWLTISYPLPPLRTAVVYLDQFVISQLMKLRNPETKGHEAVIADPFWSELLSLLERLHRMQIIVCPDSREHERESLLSPFFGPLKATYESLSGGITFFDSEGIRRSQVAVLAEAWAKGEEPTFHFNASEITYGELHGWNERFYIVSNIDKTDWATSIREARDATHETISRIFQNSWRKERKTFADWYELERAGYQRNLAEVMLRDTESRIAILTGVRAMNHEVFLPSPAELLFRTADAVIERHATPAEKPQRLASFYSENRIKDAPSIKIESAMYASIAIKAAAGQKTPPNQGMAADINLVSTLLPYCDAMFMDNGCRSILSDVPKSFQFVDANKVYSLNRKEQFIAYLRELEESASAEHLQTLREVYGDAP